MFEAFCKNCGEFFSAKRKDTQYCSTACGNTFRSRKWAQGHPDAVLQKRNIESQDLQRRIHYRVKSRAKKFGTPFDLDFDDIVVPTHCPILGMPLNFNQGRKGYHADSPSLDKIKPSGGYLKGNVRVISARANLLKNDATVEELELILEDLKRIHEN